ncbi:MAG: hypothetical protein R3208_16505 [Ketobacteraceae bacterium]|nr:hypothetical protein [Ketobacteraceae bacterium]
MDVVKSLRQRLSLAHQEPGGTMEKSRHRKLIGQWIKALITALLLIPGIAVSGQETRQAKPYHIVEIKGIETPALLEKHFDDLTLFAVKQGIMIPIPFQLEDYDDEGYSWFAESGTPLRGTENVFDQHDSLFFRYEDAGHKLDDYNASFARISAEIEVRDPETGNSRYVYVSDQLNGFIFKPLTQYDPATGVVKSDHFRLDTNPNNFLIWNDFTYKTYQGDSADTLLDTLKIRMDAGVVLENARVTLDNRNIRTEVSAIKQGPIRTVVLAKAHLTFAKIPVVFFDMSFQIYPQQYRIDAKVEVPAVLAKLLHSPHATITLDGNNLTGSLLRVSSGPERPVLVDGRMSSVETALQGTSLKKDQNWIWLSTQKGFDMVAQLFVPHNFDVPISVFYMDNHDMKERPERFRGQGPNVGYHIHDIPINDTFHFGFSAFFADSIAPQVPEAFIRNIARVPQVIATTLEQHPTQLARSAQAETHSHD